MKKKQNKTYFTKFDIKKFNNDLPIKIDTLENIIAQVTKQYPFITESEIKLIVFYFLEEIREQVIQGNSINIEEFLHNMKLYTFCKIKYNKLEVNARIQVNTPKFFRKLK